MRVLVAYGSEMGGTEGIAEILADALAAEGLTADARPARQVTDVVRYDAGVVGGAVYAGRWHGDARRFVLRHLDVLQRVPVWLFSSGPLDGSASAGPVPAVPEVADLIDRVGARGHVTFGGCLPADLEAYRGNALAQEHGGDWRDPPRIRAWASEIATGLRDARSVPG